MGEKMELLKVDLNAQEEVWLLYHVNSVIGFYKGHMIANSRTERCQ